MTKVEFEKAVAQGRMFLVRKYRFYGLYSSPKLMSAERAARKARVRTADGFCPYTFEIAE